MVNANATSVDGQLREFGARPDLDDLVHAAEQPGVDPCDVCCDAMPALLLGDVTDSDRVWIAEHTETCSYCASMLGGYRKIGSVLDRVCGCEDDCVPPALSEAVPPARRAYYGAVPSPVGDLLVARSDEGLCEIAFAGNDGEEHFQTELRTRGYRPIHDDNGITEIALQLDEYFRGERSQFEVPLDFWGVTPFTRGVLEAAANVPFGRLSTYRQIASDIGQPSASRAVGNALGRNPIPIVVPCHRIVRSDSSLGGYTGGLQIKERLLTLEGVLLG